MTEFCSTHNIRLIIDAAHPFASLLHTTVATVSEQLDLPVIRLERRYPPRDESLVWCDTFDDAIDYLESHEIRDLLAPFRGPDHNQTTTLLEKTPLPFPCTRPGRLPEIARRAGFPAENLLFWQEGQDELTLFRQLRPGAILTKESGESGYYEEKITAARQLGIPVIVIRRPSLPDSFYVVNGEHGLRYRSGTPPSRFLPSP